MKVYEKAKEQYVKKFECIPVVSDFHVEVQWLGRRKVEVEAYVMRWGAEQGRVRFQMTTTKSELRKYANEITRGMSKEVAKKFLSYIRF